MLPWQRQLIINLIPLLLSKCVATLKLLLKTRPEVFSDMGLMRHFRVLK